MSLWPELRALVWLKRLTLATESIARSQEILAAAEAARQAPRPKPQLTVFDELDVRGAERDWDARRRLEADEAGEEIDA